MIRFESPDYQVVNVKKKSRARYAVGIKKGDILRFYIGGLAGISHRGNSYATDMVMTVNGKEKCGITQGELNGNFREIFDLKEVRRN